jgi:hypothetical protein
VTTPSPNLDAVHVREPEIKQDDRTSSATLNPTKFDELLRSKAMVVSVAETQGQSREWRAQAICF